MAKLKSIMTENELLTLYRQMVLIREFEERTAEMYARGKITGFCHLYIGQEAVAVGALNVLNQNDYVISSYRDHGHCLVKGSDPKKVMAELFGRSTGLCKGKGGSMHLFDIDKNFFGGYAIVSGNLPITLGVGFAIQYMKQDRVAASFFGDGATNAGAFYESLNMAKLWSLPIIFVCENNYYGISTAVASASAVLNIRRKAESHDIPSEEVDGMDVMAVRDAMKRAVKYSRSGKGPYFIEALTYRFRGHSMADPADYRIPREEKIWKERDPIPHFARRLVEEGIIEAEGLRAVKEQVEREVEEAVQFADQSPWPEARELFTDVYSEREGDEQ
ncbi:MAG TPA: pyruvate dehydrogenase (acetyl-transferring) E1 component subunit alpha [Thermodesulfobacteriota bacterium]|nr:pyruvate dehydrogenase (acetyl-transferring) E1 component subunit alpha [Deltaproteobacteria bacterium]HNR14646.1 pyruvate dehydrogenase (acetyl-transferring) E1 component subunit alpha [Thermodesulfobacteriota bacterium]HNU70468.1 pyruvate dehydrogenase (acetyl-transferring) E1 component subunit alpha [Thermodesulfobacteriota bacterium]HOC38654.1 pyruvate dehydrogenase (acetyl-transferring) E1 component subunit alpha [Thermodesulfobacteriota bacterium]